MRLERSNTLDTVRGLAIFMVVAFHYFPNQVTNIGWTGVNLFFVLSGFLIGGILIDNRTSDTYYVTFYARRCFRIIPLYAINVLLFASIVGLDQPLWHYAFFLQNFTWISEGTVMLGWMSPTWSLAAEEQFYLILPLLIRVAPPRSIPYVAGALALAAPVYRLFMTQFLGGDWPAATQLLPGCLDSLFLGVFAAWAVREPRILAMLQRRRHWLWSLAGIGILGLVALFYDPPDPRSWLSALWISWIAVTYALIFLAVVIRRDNSGATRGPLCALGLGAYSIYLFHMPVALAAESLIPSKPLAHALALLIVGAGAIVCWYAIERPLISFARRRWRYRPQGEAAPAIAAVAAVP
jgi:peptidoglycan/LPS O-acetylase OafA/YrhL